MTTLSTRQTFLLVALFVVTSLAFIQLDNRRALDPIKAGLDAVVSPAMAAFAGLAPGRGEETGPERELTRVKAQNAELLAENARYKANEREIDELREQAKLQQEQPDWSMLPARVMGSDPSSQQMFLTIDKGTADGVEPGMAVVAQGPNYVGQVTEVEENRARVLLVIDVTHTVGVRLDGGADGIVYGMWRKGGRLELRHLDRTVPVEPGELVLTADSDAVRTARVPGGLIVGRVGDKVERSRQGDEQNVLVVPGVDFEQLQVVSVILSDAA